jgi:hypothetical protein
VPFSKDLTAAYKEYLRLLRPEAFMDENMKYSLQYK